MKAESIYSMPIGTTRYTTLCGVIIPRSYNYPTYHMCVLIPNHTDDHMCECGREWHNQVGGRGV